MIEDTIQEVLTFYNIKSEVLEKDFVLHRKIPKEHNGIYVLVQKDLVIYVGKGWVRNRQKTHWNKAFRNINEGANDPKGWKWLRENIEIEPTNWKVYYILLNKQTQLSAVEGGLIDKLQPLANDETFHDNNRILKETK
jgi:hypothetical protein